MYKNILEQYSEEIYRQFKNAEVIEEKVSDKDIVHESYVLSIVAMAIKYEAMTAELDELLHDREPRYNHPWSNTREIAEEKNIDITVEYKNAHDAWDLYNTLKHINDKTKLEQHKLFKKYDLVNIKEAAIFVKESLLALIDKLNKKS